MYQMEELLELLDDPFGVLSESNTHQLTVVARNADVAVGDFSKRGRERFYIFRTTQYANIMNRALEMDDIARNKLTMPDSYLSQDWTEELLIRLVGIVLGYAEVGEEGWTFHKPRRLPEHLTNVFRVDPDSPDVVRVMQTLLASQLGQEGLYVGDLLAGEQAIQGVKVFLPPMRCPIIWGYLGRQVLGKATCFQIRQC